jgi:hypothetical protein
MDVCVYSVFMLGSGLAQLGSLGTEATNRPIVPASGDYDDGETAGMIGRGNQSTRRKTCPMLQVGATGINQPTNQPTNISSKYGHDSEVSCKAIWTYTVYALNKVKSFPH